MTFSCRLTCALLALGNASASAQSALPKTIEARRVIIEGDHRHLSAWETHPVRTLESLPSLPSVPLDEYGGRADLKGKQTGFFHTERANGRWWIVDPLGNLYLSNGVDSVTPGNSANSKAAFSRTFGNPGRWADDTTAMLTQLGINSLGAWSDDELLRKTQTLKEHPLSYSVNLNIMSAYGHEHGGVHMGSGHQAYPQDAIFAFDPRFESFARSFLKAIEARKNDPNILGYFSDNEIPLALNNLDGLLSRAKGEPGRAAAEAFMQEHHASTPTDDLRSAFLEVEAARYFKIVSDAIHEHDPNHMYLGCRFYGRQLRQPEMFRAIAPYAEIISINYYNRWQMDPETTAMWDKEADKPFLISEFYVKADDSAMPNSSGAGWIVRTQRDRGLFYENMVISFLRTKGLVGWHWFRYQDNDPTDKSADPSNTGSNKGIVDTNYKPYTSLTSSMQRINSRMYSISDLFQKQTKETP